MVLMKTSIIAHDVTDHVIENIMSNTYGLNAAKQAAKPASKMKGL